MSATPRRELEGLPVAENAKELIADGLDPMEVHTSEIEAARQPSAAHSSNVSHVESSLSGIHEETLGITDGAIVTEERSESGVQKYDRSELVPHSGGTRDSSTSCNVWDFNQAAQDSVETKKVKGLFIGEEHDRQGHVSGCVASDSISSLGTHSSQKKKIRASRSLVMNLPGTRKRKSVRDTSHVERNSKYVKSYRTRRVECTEDTEPNVADMKEFNLENTTTSFTGLRLQCVDKTEPLPSRCSSPNDATSASFRLPAAGTTLCGVLDFSTSTVVRHEKQPACVDPRLPEGWTRRVVQRKKGASAGKFDVYIFSPEGKKFRSRKELKAFLLGNDLLLNVDGFDFSVSGKGVRAEGEVGFNETTVQGQHLMDGGQINSEPRPGRNSENFQYKTEDLCLKNVPKTQEDSEIEVADKLMDGGQINSDLHPERNSENFQDKTEDPCLKNIPKTQEDSEIEVADKLIQPSSPSLKPNAGMSRRVTSAYFSSNGVSRRNSNRLCDSDVRNKKFKSVHISNFVQGEPTVVHKRTDNEDTDERVPSHEDKIFQADVNGTVCQSVPFAKNVLKNKINTKWTPPRSPFNLVQEHLYHDPWQLLVATVFLNRTQGEVALPSLFKFFAAWPTPESIITASQYDIAHFLRPLGLQEIRAHAIKRMSQDYITKNWSDVKELFGIGKYGSDSYKIFCLNQWKCVRPTDLKLKNYVKWLWANYRSLGSC